MKEVKITRSKTEGHKYTSLPGLPGLSNLSSLSSLFAKQRLLALTLTVLTAIATLTTMSSCSATAKLTDEEKAARLQEVGQQLESGNFRFEAMSATASGGKSVQLSSSYTLDRKDGEFDAYLPFYGRAYQVSPGGNGAIEFKGEGKDIEVSLNEKKNMADLRFTIKGENDTYDVYLSTGISGYGNLNITSQNRQSISYYGSFSELKEEPKE